MAPRFPPKDFAAVGLGPAGVPPGRLQPQQMRLWLVAGPGESVDCTYGSLFFFILFKLTKATVTLSSAASRLCRYATHCYHIIFSPSSVQTFCFADETHGNGDGPVLNRKRQSICMTTTHQIERTYQSITAHTNQSHKFELRQSTSAIDRISCATRSANRAAHLS